MFAFWRAAVETLLEEIKSWELIVHLIRQPHFVGDVWAVFPRGTMLNLSLPTHSQEYLAVTVCGIWQAAPLPAADPGTTQLYLLRINLPCQSFELVQLTTQVASSGSERIQLVAHAVFSGNGSIYLMPQAKSIRFWIDSWFNSELLTCSKLCWFYFKGKCPFQCQIYSDGGLDY